MTAKNEEQRLKDAAECDAHKKKLAEKAAEAEAAAEKKRAFFAGSPPGVDEAWVRNLPDKYYEAKGAPLKWNNFSQRKSQAADSDSDSSDSDSDDE